MLDCIENLKILNAFCGISLKYGEFKSRPSHALIIKRSGKSTYRFRDVSIQLNAGEILFIPAGESYTVRRNSEEESQYALINFHAELLPKSPTLFIADNLTAILSAFHDITKVSLVDHKKNRFLALSAFYKILSLLSSDHEREYLNSRKIDLIKPALTYLEEHIFDHRLKVDNLYRLCKISDVYFRKIFTEYMGKTPRKYITEKRLAYAKSIFDEGNYTRLYEVAEAAGFSDPLYFSRIFKQYYGVSPCQMK